MTDQYLYRAGLTRPIPKLRGWAKSFGGNDGFWRPGYAISIDPGPIYEHGSWTFTVNPFAVKRNRKKSVSDYANRFHGDAAFADFSFLFGVSRHFYLVDGQNGCIIGNLDRIDERVIGAGFKVEHKL